MCGEGHCWAWQDYLCRQNGVDAYLWKAAGWKGKRAFFLELTRPWISRFPPWTRRSPRNRLSTIVRKETPASFRTPPDKRSLVSGVPDFLTQFCRNWPHLACRNELFVALVSGEMTVKSIRNPMIRTVFYTVNEELYCLNKLFHLHWSFILHVHISHLLIMSCMHLFIDTSKMIEPFSDNEPVNYFVSFL